MKNTEILHRSFTLLSVKQAEAPAAPATPKPFFPGGKATFALPRQEALAANRRISLVDPRKVIGPYYARVGGLDTAISEAKNYSQDNPQIENPYQHVGERHARYAQFDRQVLSMPSPEGVGSATLVHPRLAKYPLVFLNPKLDRSHSGSESSRAINHLPEKGLVADTAASTQHHELNHAMQAPGILRSPRAGIGTDDDNVRGYFSRKPEEDQALARVKQETAALTGRLLKSPSDYDQLLQEINPQAKPLAPKSIVTDPLNYFRSDEARAADAEAFEKRIAPYSQEAQRYWRFLRRNSDDKEYYQKALQRGRERMPLMVQQETAAPIKAAAFLRPLIQHGVKALGSAARFGAAVPAQEKFWSTPAAGLARTAKLGLFPHLGKHLNVARMPIQAYTAVSLHDAWKNLQTANREIQQQAGNLLEPSKDLRNAVQLAAPSAKLPDVDAATWDHVPQAAPLRAMLRAGQTGGLASMWSAWHQQRDRVEPKVRQAVDNIATNVAKDVATNVGVSLRNTPAWHQIALALTSPAQFAARRFLLPKRPPLISYEDRVTSGLNQLATGTGDIARATFDRGMAYWKARRSATPLTSQTRLIQAELKRLGLPHTVGPEEASP